MSGFYEVIPAKMPVNYNVTVPGSKSITNRALLLAQLAHGKSVLKNVLFSDDSRGFMQCLKDLGADIAINEAAKTVEITGLAMKAQALVNVRSAGTAARFITAMLAALEGEYIIEASEQMKKRPMRPLFDTLVNLGAKVTYLETEGFLPVKLYGAKLAGGEVSLEARQSSQFLSAILMTGVLHENNLRITPLGAETSKSYIDITIKMMESFGVCAKRENGVYLVKAGQKYKAANYEIEPDISAACYFYAAALLTGGKAQVNGVRFNSMQGDIKFLEILKDMGGKITETPEGVLLEGSDSFNGIDVDMNNCSDQTMTLAAIAPFAKTPTTIRNIAHIKHQESNRVNAILTELAKMGVKCEEIQDGIKIYPSDVKPALVETYDDHRMAMAFALTGLRTPGIRIANPQCCGKTFENYFEVFASYITRDV
ncbi:MAG: 3-phosphoshikimate 1-carboxyvinyltransferase [Clostridiales bacterium]|nr:3-phosphoshikimate 1-carboxyvinyltransferase [Clostridiales bacterium]